MITKAIFKINPNAKVIVRGTDINTCKIEWLDGTTPISKADIQAQFPAVEFDMAMENLRAKRDRLLADTDWKVIAAKEKGTTLSAGFKAYRQALRDLPSTVTDEMTAEDVNNIQFPTE